MQDRFKFRYHNNNKIYDVSAIDFTRSRGEIVSLDKMETLMCKLDLNNLIQCTGLKDKNGKLIYEGDIIKYFCPAEYCSDGVHKCPECYSGENGSVYYDEDLAMYEYRSKSDECPLTDNINTEEDLEIIGSIYENPELLEEDQNEFKTNY